MSHLSKNSAAGLRQKKLINKRVPSQFISFHLPGLQGFEPRNDGVRVRHSNTHFSSKINALPVLSSAFEQTVSNTLFLKFSTVRLYHKQCSNAIKKAVPGFYILSYYTYNALSILLVGSAGLIPNASTMSPGW